MGTLRYAILGLLDRRDMTGYELTQEFNSSLSEFWSARHSQIYPELRSLADDGLVTFEVETASSALEKKRYSITTEGHRAFLAWERKPQKPKPTPKDEFRLQLFFSDCLKAGERETLLQDQLCIHEERLEHLRANEAQLTGGEPDTLDNAAWSDYLVLLGAIEREEGTCRWLNRCLGLDYERASMPTQAAAAASSTSSVISNELRSRPSM
ncbi:PadR family transcriptional regulator [Paratractidigestivibacter sp.]|uniref:PadR family transcriptional regulator n=1 Tax=Paratractidigestivibacter sp. TaxID=2847316 RepID=UPI002AC938D2|nr:PadR family transcriptional regulator [Paratractidigestivibacter sp.]